jgi:hypothetical protein
VQELGLILERNLEIEQLAYPVFLFKEGYVYLARNLSEFTRWDRRVADDSAPHEWQIADAEGRLARIHHLQRIDPPSRLQGLMALLTSIIFVKPAIEITQQMTLPDFQRYIEPMLLEHRMYGNAFGDDEQAFLRDLRKANSFPELFQFMVNAV